MGSKLNLKKIRLLALGLFLSFLPDYFLIDQGFNDNSLLVLRLLIIMIFFWISEVIPISVTALFPILLIPFLPGIESKDILQPYASSVVFLLLGGFILAIGFEKSRLHERIALRTILYFGNTRKSLLMCLILSTAFFSMWLSNTATCLLMLPIVKYIIDQDLKKKDDYFFSKLILLSIAYSASIGGMATPIGTIPNAIFIGFMNEQYNLRIDFVNWVLFTFPIVISLLLILWVIFSYKVSGNNKKINKANIFKKYSELGKFSLEEKIAVLILTSTALLWVFKPHLNDYFNLRLNDASIAIFGGVCFFIFPGKSKEFSILDSSWFKNVPWNVLILFGGGLSLASLIVNTGLSDELSNFLDFMSKIPILFLILGFCFLISILTEFISNTATTFLFLPIVSSFAFNNEISAIFLCLPGVLAASCAFMMPISTPPNAIIYSTERLTIPFMITIGSVMNIIAVLLISFYVIYFGKFFYA